MINVKKCKICITEKGIDEFPTRGEGRIRAECRACYTKISKTRYDKRKSETKVHVSMKICNKCGQEKGRDNFRVHPANKDGLDSNCKKCALEYHQSDVIRNYLREKKESGKQKEILQKYREKHHNSINDRKRELRSYAPRLFRMAEGRIRSQLRKDVHEKMGGECVECGEDTSHKLCIDHKNDDGGQERKTSVGTFRGIASKILKGFEWENIYQLLCFNCNRRKQVVRIRSRIKNDRPEILDEKSCSQCRRVLPIGLFAWSKERPSGISYCKDCACDYHRQRRLTALKRLGGECKKCGEKDPDVLEIDHINDDGAEKRKSGDDSFIHQKIITGERNLWDLQILCANCNAEKEYYRIKGNAYQSDRPVETKKARSTVPTRKFDKKQIMFSVASVDESKNFLNSFHYANFGRSAKKIYKACINDEIVAIIKFSPVIRKEVATSLGLSVYQVIELDRFCINPEFQERNVASYILSRAVKIVRKDFPEVVKIVSFADTEQDHCGTIYKATNWKMVGETKNSYIYIDPLGHAINKKTLYGRATRACMREKEYADINSLTRVVILPKIKFTYDLQTSPGSQTTS